MNSQYASPYAVSSQPTNVRRDFIRKTYTLLAISLAVFTLVQAGLFQWLTTSNLDKKVLSYMYQKSSATNILMLAGFIGISMLATKIAYSRSSTAVQSLGLVLYMALMTVLVQPLLLYVNFIGNTAVIGQAAVLTIALSLGLTFLAFATKKDFSFLGKFLIIGAFIMLGLIVVAIFTSLNLHLLIVLLGVGIAAVSILYNTSNIIHHYEESEYVAAALSLFSGIVMLFYYLVMLLTGREE